MRWSHRAHLPLLCLAPTSGLPGKHFMGTTLSIHLMVSVMALQSRQQWEVQKSFPYPEGTWEKCGTSCMCGGISYIALSRALGAAQAS